VRHSASKCRFDEADEASRESEGLTHPGDVASEVLWRIVRAQVHAHRGEHAQALRLAREAVAWVERADVTAQIAGVYSSLSYIPQAAGRRDEALAALACTRAVRAERFIG
jgi:ATP/maltotriose-dependent transcriptional regulator MalT